eukprot:213159_1
MVQHEPLPIAIIATIASIIWLVSIICITILFIRTLKKKASCKIKSQLTYRLSISVMIFQLFSAIMMCSRRFAGSLRDYGISKLMYPNPLEMTLEMLGVGAFYIAWTLLLFTFISRLYACFRSDSSSYGYSKCFYIFIVSEITIVTLLSFISAIISESLKAIIHGSVLLFAIINGILLTYLFVRSLQKVIKDTGDAHDNSPLINIMVKFVVLVSLSMLTSILLSIFIAVAGVTGNIIFDAVVLLFQPIDAFANVLCLYLQFTFSREDYEKWLPKYHSFVLYLFTKETKNEIVMCQQMSKDGVRSTSPSVASSQTQTQTQTEHNQCDLINTQATVDSNV